MKEQPEYSLHPTWWNEQYNSTWDRVREAFRRDWEQTKADLWREGRDLHQTVSDTVKQALGTEPLPLPHQPTPHLYQDEWERVERALRYGYGARAQYAEHADWDDRLEEVLRNEWATLNTDQPWKDARDHVRRGWDSSPHKL